MEGMESENRIECLYFDECLFEEMRQEKGIIGEENDSFCFF